MKKKIIPVFLYYEENIRFIFQYFCLSLVNTRLPLITILGTILIQQQKQINSLFYSADNSISSLVTGELLDLHNTHRGSTVPKTYRYIRLLTFSVAKQLNLFFCIRLFNVWLKALLTEQSIVAMQMERIINSSFKIFNLYRTLLSWF